MLETAHPLLERMTFFWHNHFAKIDRVPRLYYGLGAGGGAGAAAATSSEPCGCP
jgi:hypothetical protein